MMTVRGFKKLKFIGEYSLYKNRKSMRKATPIMGQKRTRIKK